MPLLLEENLRRKLGNLTGPLEALGYFYLDSIFDDLADYCEDEALRRKIILFLTEKTRKRINSATTSEAEASIGIINAAADTDSELAETRRSVGAGAAAGVVAGAAGTDSNPNTDEYVDYHFGYALATYLNTAQSLGRKQEHHLATKYFYLLDKLQQQRWITAEAHRSVLDYSESVPASATNLFMVRNNRRKLRDLLAFCELVNSQFISSYKINYIFGLYEDPSGPELDQLVLEVCQYKLRDPEKFTSLREFLAFFRRFLSNKMDEQRANDLIDALLIHLAEKLVQEAIQTKKIITPLFSRLLMAEFKSNNKPDIVKWILSVDMIGDLSDVLNLARNLVKVVRAIRYNLAEFSALNNPESRNLILNFFIQMIKSNHPNTKGFLELLIEACNLETAMGQFFAPSGIAYLFSEQLEMLLDALTVAVDNNAQADERFYFQVLALLKIMINDGNAKRRASNSFNLSHLLGQEGSNELRLKYIALLKKIVLAYRPLDVLILLHVKPLNLIAKKDISQNFFIHLFYGINAPLSIYTVEAYIELLEVCVARDKSLSLAIQDLSEDLYTNIRKHFPFYYEMFFRLIFNQFLSKEQLERAKEVKGRMTDLLIAKSRSLTVLPAIELLSQALNPESYLGRYFHLQRGDKTPSVDRGCLAAIRRELERRNPGADAPSLPRPQQPSLFARIRARAAFSQPAADSDDEEHRVGAAQRAEPESSREGSLELLHSSL